jgi:hypothetical protein
VREAAAIVREAGIAEEIAVAAGVLAEADAVAVVVDVRVAAVVADDTAGMVAGAEDGTNFFATDFHRSHG